MRVKPLTLLSRERWGEGVDVKKEERTEKAKVKRLNYTSCSQEDRRGVGNVARKANRGHPRCKRAEKTRKPKPSIPNKE